MEEVRDIQIRDYEDWDYAGKRVLLRLDINSPIDPKTKRIKDRTRLTASLPTLERLLAQGAKVAIIAHQGDTLDYQNLISLEEHAEILDQELDYKITYIDDVCGPAALEAVEALEPGQAVILGNLRYLTEEVSHFEKVVPLTPEQMAETRLVRKLAPLFDCYVNDAFAAAHRACPSMIGFQEVLPSAAGELFFREVSVLTKVLQKPDRPSLFILGGAKISDAFGMMEQVLAKGTADKILTSGVTGVVFLLASGIKVGETYEQWLKERQFDAFIPMAKDFLERFPDRICMPVDLAYEGDGERREIKVEDLPHDAGSFLDIGAETLKLYADEIARAGTMFINGPAGVYENELFEDGTRAIWEAVAASDGYSVIGGGDSVSAAGKYIDLDDISYVCTAGGAMVRFMTGETLPLVAAMEKALARETK